MTYYVQGKSTYDALRLTSFFLLICSSLYVAPRSVHSQELLVSIESRHSARDFPNIILIMCDDLGYGDLKCFNPESPIATPNLDAMASAGLKLTRFYAASAVCSPTRASCLTGRHPSRMGILHANVGHLPEDEWTIAELLSDKGFATGHFGKWHLGTLTTEIVDSNRGGPRGAAHFQPPARHGFDVNFSTEAKVPTFDPMWKPQDANGVAWDSLESTENGVPYGTHYWNTAGEVVEENLRGDDSRVIMDRAVEFISTSAKSDRPFLAVIWLHAPHLPVVAGEEHVRPYAEHDVHHRNYYGCVAAIDEQIGRLRKSLTDNGVSDETLIWFCSDNGPQGRGDKAPGLTGGLRGRKTSLFEGGVRVPGILVWPAKIPAGSTSDFPCVTSDFLPTIAELLNHQEPFPKQLDGISLVPLLSQLETGSTEAFERQQPIGFHLRKQATWVTHRYKLYRNGDNASWQLYDLLDDRNETMDLAGDNPEIVARLAKQYDQWRKSCETDASRLKATSNIP